MDETRVGVDGRTDGRTDGRVKSEIYFRMDRGRARSAFGYGGDDDERTRRMGTGCGMREGF
jgi:hypothetical protein